MASATGPDQQLSSPNVKRRSPLLIPSSRDPPELTRVPQMSSTAVERLNAALSGRYGIEREVGEGGMATVGC